MNYIFLFDALLPTFVDFNFKTLFEIIRLFFFIFRYKIWSVRLIKVNLYLDGQFSAEKVSGLRRVRFMSVRFIEGKLIRIAFWPNKIFKTVRFKEVSGL